MDDPEGEVVQTLVYNSGTTDNSITDTCRGEIMGAVGWYCVKIYPSRLCEVCNRWKDDDAHMPYRFTVNKMTKISIRAKKHELTNDMMKRAKGKNCEIQQIKPDDFHVRYEHAMAVPGLIGFLQILKGLEAEAARGAVLGACEEPPPIRGHAKISPRRWPVFLAQLSGTVWQPITGHGILLFVSRL